MGAYRFLATVVGNTHEIYIRFASPSCPMPFLAQRGNAHKNTWSFSSRDLRNSRISTVKWQPIETSSVRISWQAWGHCLKSRIKTSAEIWLPWNFWRQHSIRMQILTLMAFSPWRSLWHCGKAFKSESYGWMVSRDESWHRTSDHLFGYPGSFAFYWTHLSTLGAFWYWMTSPG